MKEVKEKTDIVQLIGEYVQLKKAGRNLKGLCPFHGEKSPSFMVNPELQIFKCFGCGEGGDVFSFLQKIEGMEFGEALQTLAKKAGITLTSYKPNQAEQMRDRLYAMHELLANAYHFVLTKHQSGAAALAYAKGRGISDEAIEVFRLGYVPERWDFAVEFLHTKKRYTLQELEQAGLGITGRSGLYDRFRNRLMFPLANSRGQVVGFAGRVLPGADEKAGGKYINSPETEIYHKGDLLYAFDITRSHIKQAGMAVVVEGEIDLIASWQAGVKQVVAIKGSALTHKQIELLRRVCDTIVIALDADGAGDAAARRGIALAESMGLVVKVATWDGGKDPGEIAMTRPDEWKQIIEKAIPVYDFYIQSAVKRHGTDVVGKRRISAELMPIWAEIGDEIVKAHYIHVLAEVLGVRDDDVRAQLGKTQPQQAPNQVQTPAPVVDRGPVKKSRREVVEEYLVGLALRGGMLSKLIAPDVIELIQTPFWKKVVEFIAGYGVHATTAEIIQALPAELRTRVEDLVLTDQEMTRDQGIREWEKALSELEESMIRAQIQGGIDDSQMVALTKRLGELTKRR